MLFYLIFIGGVRNNSQFFLENQEKFYYDIFIPYLKDNNITTLWMLGDFYENRKMISTSILNRTHLFLNTLEEMNIKSYFILGNDDVAFKNTNIINSLKPITKAFKNIHLIEEFETINFDGLNIGFISWISPEINDKAINWIKNVNASIICGHFPINSFEIIKGIVCSKGLDTNLFERFDSVFSGHFHIRATNGIIQYIGNPSQTNWGEYGYPKGFGVFDTETKKICFIDNPYNIYEIIKFNDDFDISNIDLPSFENKIVRVVANNNKNKKKLEVLIDNLNSKAYYVEVIENNDITVSSENKDDIIPTDTIEVISQFLDTCKIEHIDRNKLDSIILDIYQEALERGVVEC